MDPLSGRRKRQRDDTDDDDKPNPANDSGPVEDDSDSSDAFDWEEAELDDETFGDLGACEYDESQEDMPLHLVYDKDFLQMQNDLIGIANHILDVLKDGTCQNERVKKCKDKAANLTKIPRANTERIALIGNTGAGKSSLVNSLLGMPGLAKAVAGGESCTYVGTEYERPFEGQGTKFMAKIEYYDETAIKRLLEDWLRDYNNWVFEKDKHWTEEARQDFFRLYNTALSAFTELFCDKAVFNSPESAAIYLNQDYFQQRGDALTIMLQWCQDMLLFKPTDGDEITENLRADTQGELHGLLDPMVSSNATSREPRLWPLVKKVRIGIEGPKILDHVVLTDLPGLDDTNRVRVKTSYDMLKSCDSIWVVTKIGRAITDSNVDSAIMRYGKSYDMAVICTGSDEYIYPSLAAYLENEGQNIGNHRELYARETELQKEVNKKERLIKAIKSKLKEANTTSTGRRQKPLSERSRGKLTSQLTKSQGQLSLDLLESSRLAQRRFDLLVDARNQNTARRLQKEKSIHLQPGKQLQVFCVSNHHYDALKGAVVLEGSKLTPEMTGIPAMREFIFKSTAPRLLAAFDDYTKHVFVVFIKGLALWTNPFCVESRGALLSAIEAPQEKVESCVKAYLDKVSSSHDKIIIHALQEAQPSIRDEALRVAEEKRKWHTSSLKAFIRRDGNHTTSVVPRQSWNEQFSKTASETIVDGWVAFAEAYTKESETLLEELTKLINDVRSMLKENPASFVLPMKRLDELFDAQIKGILNIHGEHQRQMKKELRNIKLDATQDRDSGYFTQVMSSTYTRCKSFSGTGMRNLIVTTFKGHLGQKGTESPFNRAAEKQDTELMRSGMKQTAILCEQISKILKDIHYQFDLMMVENTIDPVERVLQQKVKKLLLATVDPRLKAVETTDKRLRAKLTREALREVRFGTTQS